MTLRTEGTEPEDCLAVILVVRDPDASNDFFRYERRGILIHDIDAGGMDLDDPTEYHEWLQHHEETAKALSAAGWDEAAEHIRDIAAGYEPDEYEQWLKDNPE